jgi:hypothetical protein
LAAVAIVGGKYGAEGFGVKMDDPAHRFASITEQETHRFSKAQEDAKKNKSIIQRSIEGGQFAERQGSQTHKFGLTM